MDELYISRCFDLARLGVSRVSPNPLVGAVIVAVSRIIGEGYHHAYGEPHAEVNAIRSIKPAHKHLLAQSTIYVSLEPCCIHGNTPPCTNLILDHNIPKVVVSAIDYSPDVNGKSLHILRQSGLQVKQDIFPAKGKQLSYARTTFVCKQRPYVILKYAKSKDGFMASENGTTVWFTNPFTKRLTHKWRSEINAIMVGSNTAKLDNPALTTRHYFGKNPLRIVLDRNLSLDQNLNIFNKEAKTIVFNQVETEKSGNIHRIKVEFDKNLAENLLKVLYQQQIGTLMIEGGPTLLNTFIEANLWDEARVLTGSNYLVKGVKAPALPVAPEQRFTLQDNEISIFINKI